jgi:putative SOS response-associated peptidase YedK
VLFAGLLSEEDPGARPAFAILTTGANLEVRALHDRMPVLLPEPLLAAWLAEAPPPELPSPADGVLAIRPVSRRVNSVRNDDPACLASPAPEPQLALKLG